MTKSQRSRVMSKIRGKDTRPELAVRSVLHRMGYRFRLHRRDLPGSPDIVLPKYRAVVFVHGCFWHRHEGCSKAYTVKTDPEGRWRKKFEQNVERDRRVRAELRKLGWKVIVVWECRICELGRLQQRFRRRLRLVDVMDLQGVPESVRVFGASEVPM